MIQGLTARPWHFSNEGRVNVAEWFIVALDHEIVEVGHFFFVRFWVLGVVWPACYSR